MAAGITIMARNRKDAPHPSLSPQGRGEGVREQCVEQGRKQSQTPASLSLSPRSGERVPRAKRGAGEGLSPQAPNMPKDAPHPTLSPQERGEGVREQRAGRG